MTKVKYTGTGKIVENWQPKPQPIPEQSYKRAMRGLTKAWKASTGYDKLPKPGEDVLDYIKPSEEHWIRILKGLDEGRKARIGMFFILLYVYWKYSIRGIVFKRDKKNCNAESVLYSYKYITRQRF